MGSIVEQGAREFIVFRGTVDLVVRIGQRNQRTMTEKRPCAGSINVPTVENGPYASFESSNLRVIDKFLLRGWVARVG